MTAEELMAQLQADPEYVARERARDQALQQDDERLARAEAPLLRDLAAAGASLSSVWDLVNTRKRYPALVPVLLKHLDREYPPRIRQGIARALAVPEARVGWKQLLRSYAAEPERDSRGEINEMKWALHLAIAAAADVSVLDDLIGLAAKRQNGECRSLFVDALDRIGGPRARAALEELRRDPDLAEAFERLSKKQKRRVTRRSR